MPKREIKCGCETEPDILTMVVKGVVPIAQLVCRNCKYALVCVGVDVTNA